MKIKISETEKKEILNKYNTYLFEATRDFTVRDLQNFLIKNGAQINPDNVLGRNTVNAYFNYLNKGKSNVGSEKEYKVPTETGQSTTSEG